MEDSSLDWLSTGETYRWEDVEAFRDRMMDEVLACQFELDTLIRDCEKPQVSRCEYVGDPAEMWAVLGWLHEVEEFMSRTPIPDAEEWRE